jgi:hypothetical protein
MPAVPNPYLNRVPVPTPPAPTLPYDEQPLYQRVEKLKAALALVVGLLVFTILAAALWPTGQLRLADEQAASIGRPTADYRPYKSHPPGATGGWQRVLKPSTPAKIWLLLKSPFPLPRKMRWLSKSHLAPTSWP